MTDKREESYNKNQPTIKQCRSNVERMVENGKMGWDNAMADKVKECEIDWRGLTHHKNALDEKSRELVTRHYSMLNKDEILNKAVEHKATLMNYAYNIQDRDNLIFDLKQQLQAKEQECEDLLEGCSTQFVNIKNLTLENINLEAKLEVAEELLSKAGHIINYHNKELDKVIKKGEKEYKKLKEANKSLEQIERGE